MNMIRLKKKASPKNIVAFWCKCSTNLCGYAFSQTAQLAAAEKSNAL